jgi:hypothetical protein
MVASSGSLQAMLNSCSRKAGPQLSYVSPVQCTADRSGVCVWWSQGVLQVFFGLLSIAQKEEGSSF